MVTSKFFKPTLNWIRLQTPILLLSIGGIIAKKASQEPFFSLSFIVYFILEIVVLVLYAILWQQILKRFDVSVAYSNKGSVIIWTFIWAVLLFNETITLFNIIGALIIITGITLVFRNVE